MLYSHREAVLNWLAFGLLLAAWNAADDSGQIRNAPAGVSEVPRRPAALRAYPQVSVRAVARMRSEGKKIALE